MKPCKTTHRLPTYHRLGLNKKPLRETQTLRAKNFRPAAGPIPGGAGPPKFKQLEMVTTCTYRLSVVKIDACNFELSW